MAPSSFTTYFERVTACLAQMDLTELGRVTDVLKGAAIRLASVWLIGNGGSAATAAHFAVDLRKQCQIPAVALPELVPMTTAYANDDGLGKMFSYPLHLMLRPRDVLIAFSCSGKSMNVVEAARMAGKERLIVFTGNPGTYNLLATVPNSGLVYAQSDDIRVQEDAHLAVCHALVGAIKER